MNVMTAARPAPPLHDLLGASFVFNARITALAWDGGIACFGLGDGAVVMMPQRWEGAPSLRPRAGGGAEIVAGTSPPPPPAIVAAHQGTVLTLASDPRGGVLSGGADGKFLRIADGKTTTIEEKPRREIAAVAAGRGGRRAFAAGRQVDRLGPEGGRLTTPGAVASLAYDPSGLHLAVGYQGGVTLEAAGIRDAPAHEQAETFLRLAWRRDGLAFAAAGENSVVVRDRGEKSWRQMPALPGPPLALAYAADGALIVAGADYVRCHRDGAAPFDLRAGMAAPIACHPRLNLLACADPAGAIWLSTPGQPGALLAREPGPAPNCLAFAPDGEALAFATEENEAGTVMLPDILFRIGETR